MRKEIKDIYDLDKYLYDKVLCEPYYKDWTILTKNISENSNPILSNYDNKRRALKEYFMHTEKHDNRYLIKIFKNGDDVSSIIENFVNRL